MISWSLTLKCDGKEDVVVNADSTTEVYEDTSDVPDSSCGDNQCEPFENGCSCGNDCGPCEPICGDGACSESEDECNCPIDCGTECDDLPPIPTVSEWGLIIMTLLALTAGTIVFARRRRPTLA